MRGSYNFEDFRSAHAKISDQELPRKYTQTSKMSSNLDQHSQEHEKREQLLFKAATIMKLHDNCMKRINSQVNQNLSPHREKSKQALLSQSSRDFGVSSVNESIKKGTIARDSQKLQV